jgi:hypothetical protein
MQLIKEQNILKLREGQPNQIIDIDHVTETKEL